jgi:dATP pyrophosphohydrolase
VAHKQPRSVQVVVFAQRDGSRCYLLLKRVAEFGGHWQAVTGSLESGESHVQAALREVEEETGIPAKEEDLIPLGLTNTFEIAPSRRYRYAPGVTVNEEVCFALRVDTLGVRLDALEHDDFVWVDYETAMTMLHWESNTRAITATQALMG